MDKFNYTLLWMACRYAIPRDTIACKALPLEIVVNYEQSPLSKEQKEVFIRDLEYGIQEAEKLFEGRKFRDWKKLIEFLKTT